MRLPVPPNMVVPADDRIPVGGDARVRLMKQDGGEVSYDVSVLRDDGNHIVVRGPWLEDQPRDLGFVVFEPRDVFTEHYWRDRWYSIKGVRDLNGVGKGWYCDVARPVRIESGVIVSADLMLDLWVPVSGEPVRLDQDEFFRSRLAADRDPATARRALAALRQLEHFAHVRFVGITA